MKKQQLIIVVVLLLMLTGSPVGANGGPHGGYASTVQQCAACHRAHTAVGSSLILFPSFYELCISCHGSGASGADTNVIDGVYSPSGRGLNGGGFVYARMNTDYNGPLSGTVTSSHGVTGEPGTVWGEGLVGPGKTMSLECVHCHDPHGNKSYRILRESLGVVSQTDELTKSYDTATYGTGQGSWGISRFCAACHTQYMSPTSIYDAGDGSGSRVRYRHGVDIQQNPGYTTSLPLGDDGTLENEIICLTCHVAHGTSASVSAIASVAPANDSTLLRLDNRGVCEDCHSK